MNTSCFESRSVLSVWLLVLASCGEEVNSHAAPRDAGGTLDASARRGDAAVGELRADAASKHGDSGPSSSGDGSSLDADSGAEPAAAGSGAAPSLDPGAARAPAVAGDRTEPNYVRLQSDMGDPIARGAQLEYVDADALLRAEVSSVGVQVTVEGDETWQGVFGLRPSEKLKPGHYPVDPSSTLSSAKLNWSSLGNECGSRTGWFDVDAIRYQADALSEISLRFEQHCQGEWPALRGQLHWSQANLKPPGPLQPPPVDLWRAEASATPSSGAYVYLEGQAGDFVSGGRAQTFTRSNAGLFLTDGQSGVGLMVQGDTIWSGHFSAMRGVERLRPGYYGPFRRNHFNPAVGGLLWGGDGRGCNFASGWFVVDQVRYVDDLVSALDLRFEQHCEGREPALHGQIHWIEE